VFAAVLAAFTSAPYLAGMLLHFPGSRFEHVLNFQADFHSYLAFMRQARDGQWLFHSPYTSEPHSAALLNLEWLAFGKLARLLGGSLEAALHVQRVGSILLLAFGLYRLCAMLTPDVWKRRFLLAFVLLGGGFGWMQHTPWLRNWTQTLQSYDLFAGFHPFFWMLIAPHFLLAQALAVWTLVLVLSHRYRMAAALLIVTGAVRPFEMLQLSAAIGLFGLLRRSAPVLAVVAAPLPLWLYYAWLFRIHPVFRWWSLQNIFPPPRPALLLASLGLGAVLYLLARLGLPELRHPDRQPAPRLLLICSALTGVALVYSYPLFTFTFQLVTTLAIPIGLIGALRLGRNHLALILLAVNSLTSAVLWRANQLEVRQGHHRSDVDLIAAYHWLGQHTRPRELVLASELDSNRIPRYSHNAMFWGYLTTVDNPRKKLLAQRFFDASTPEPERREFLAHHGIRYLFLRAGHDPPPAPLEPVFRNRAAVIYRVIP
jgi:hypothetical protein